jgi:hypothetical protein
LETCVPSAIASINWFLVILAMMVSFVEAQKHFKAHVLRTARHSVWNAAKPRSSLLVHAYGHEVPGLKTYRGPKRKEQFGVCSRARTPPCSPWYLKRIFPNWVKTRPLDINSLQRKSNYQRASVGGSM